MKLKKKGLEFLTLKKKLGILAPMRQIMSTKEKYMKWAKHAVSECNERYDSAKFSC